MTVPRTNLLRKLEKLHRLVYEIDADARALQLAGHERLARDLYNLTSQLGDVVRRYKAKERV